MSELQRLRDRIDELEELLGLRLELPNKFGITPLETKIVGLLIRRDVASKELIYSAIWGGLPECDQPDPKTIEVHICKMRRKLKPYNIEIKTRHGVGYYIEDDARSGLREFAQLGGRRQNNEWREQIISTYLINPQAATQLAIERGLSPEYAYKVTRERGLLPRKGEVA